MTGPQVQTKYGIVEGARENEQNIFRGIPFAKTGDPSSDTLGSWPSYGDKRETMMIGEQTSVREAPFEIRFG